MKMELWIRSQDKECLMKVDRIDYDYSTHTHRIMANGYETLIGLYETKERALEVLDEIQNILKPQLIIKDSGKIIGSFEDTIVREGATYELKELSTYLYQMPKE